ncbi:MAG: WG repeat-containing protein, partial [Bacteroidota bacterium]
YDMVESFENGWAIVHRDGKRGYVNAKGEEVIKPQFDRAWNFSVEYKGLAKVQVNGKTGYINTKGKKVSSPKRGVEY